MLPLLPALLTAFAAAPAAPVPPPGPDAWGAVRVSPDRMPARNFTIAPDGRDIAFFGYSKAVFVYDVAAGRVRAEAACDEGPHHAAYSPDGKTLAVAEWSAGLRLRDPRTLAVLDTLKPDSGLGVSDPRFLPGGKLAAYCYGGSAAGLKDQTAVWDLSTKAQVGWPAAEHDETGGAMTRRKFASHGPYLISVMTKTDRGSGYIVNRSAFVTEPAANAPSPVAALDMQDDWVFDASPDGRTLLVQNVNRPPRLVDIATGQTTHVLSGYGQLVTCGAFSHDGRYVVTGSGTRTSNFPPAVYPPKDTPTDLTIWETATGKRLAVYVDKSAGHDYSQVAFSPDGKYVAAVTKAEERRGKPSALGGKLILWGTLPTATPAPAPAAQIPPSAPNLEPWGVARVSPGRVPGANLAVSPDGGEIALFGGDTVRLFDVAAGRVAREFPRSGSMNVSFAPDGFSVAVAEYGDGLSLRDRRTGKVTDQVIPANGPMHVQAVMHLADGRLAVIGYRVPAGGRGWRPVLAVRDPAVKENEGWVFSPALDDPPGEHAYPTLSADGKMILHVGYGPQSGGGTVAKSVAVVNPATGAASPRVKLEAGDEYVLDASPDGQRVAVFNRTRPVRVIDLPTGQVVATLGESRQLVTTAAFSPDGRRLVTGSGANRRINLPPGPFPPADTPTELALWDVATGKKLSEFRDPAAAHDYLKVAFSPDGRFVAALTTSPEETSRQPRQGGRLVLWGQVPASTTAPTAPAAAVAPPPVPKNPPTGNAEIDRLQAEIDRLQAELAEVKKTRAVAGQRFVDRGEYVEDTETGLLWQKDGAVGVVNFYGAFEHAVKLKLGGMAGWRVPTAAEFKAIDPAGDAIFGTTRTAYWTGDIDASGPDYAFVYTRGRGANNCSASANQAFVRCVHDPVRQGPKP